LGLKGLKEDIQELHQHVDRCSFLNMISEQQKKKKLGNDAENFNPLLTTDFDADIKGSPPCDYVITFRVS
jgi:hypothetical protein